MALAQHLLLLATIIAATAITLSAMPSTSAQTILITTNTSSSANTTTNNTNTTPSVPLLPPLSTGFSNAPPLPPLAGVSSQQLSGQSTMRRLAATLSATGSFTFFQEMLEKTGSWEMLKNRTDAGKNTTLLAFSNDKWTTFMTPKRKAFVAKNATEFKMMASIHLLSVRHTRVSLMKLPKNTMILTLLPGARRIRIIQPLRRVYPQFNWVSNQELGPVRVTVQGVIFTSLLLTALEVNDVLRYHYLDYIV